MMITSFLIIVLTINLTLFTSCQSVSIPQTASQQQTEPEEVWDLLPSNGVQIPEEEYLELEGQTREPCIAEDGHRLLYIAAHTNRHKNPQVYEYDWLTKKSRRLTFHDGESGQPIYWPGHDRIIYLSTTDEIKENPPFLRKLNNEQQPVAPSSEIYASGRNTFGIERWSYNPGLDGEMAIRPNGTHLVYISERSGSRKMLLRDLKDRREIELAPGSGIKSSPDWNRTGENLVWIEKSPGRKTPTRIISADAKGSDPVVLWETQRQIQKVLYGRNNDELFISTDHQHPGNLEIYRLSLNSQQLERLTYTSANEKLGDINGQGDRLVFWRELENTSRVVVMSITNR